MVAQNRADRESNPMGLIRANGSGPPSKGMPQPKPGEQHDVALAVDGIYRYAILEAADLALNEKLSNDMLARIALERGVQSNEIDSSQMFAAITFGKAVAVQLLERALEYAKERAKVTHGDDGSLALT